MRILVVWAALGALLAVWVACAGLEGMLPPGTDRAVGWGLEHARASLEDIPPLRTQHRTRTLFGDLTVLVQVSDLHLNDRDACPLETFRTLLHRVLPLIRPAVVLVTGDLTNGKVPRGFGAASAQLESEWRQYARALEEARQAGVLTDDLLWVDLPGNHDDFGVRSWGRGSDDDDKPSVGSALYQQYGVSAARNPSVHPRHPRLHAYDIADGRIRLVRIDAVPEPGAHRPLNFFGALRQAEDWRRLQLLLSEADTRTEAVISLAHYPSSCIAYDGRPHPFLRRARAAPFRAHLSGHLHTLNGLSSYLYAENRRGGFVELVLGDLVGHWRFRVLAVDHASGRLTFRDYALLPAAPNATATGACPRAAPTAPRQVALLLNPSPLGARGTLRSPARTAASTSPLRLVVWRAAADTHPPAPLRVWVHGRHVGDAAGECEFGGSVCLFQLPWTPSAFPQRRPLTIHFEPSADVRAAAAAFTPETFTVQLDGAVYFGERRAASSSMARLALLTHAPTLLVWSEGAAAVVALSLLAVGPWMRRPATTARNGEGVARRWPFVSRLAAPLLQLYVRQRAVWQALLVMVAWLAVGPLVFARLVDGGGWAVAFSWNTCVWGIGWLHHPSDARLLYSIQLGTVALPLLLACALLSADGAKTSSGARAPRYGRASPCAGGMADGMALMALVPVTLFELNNLTSIHGAYGWCSVLLSPVAMPMTLLTAWAVYRCRRRTASSPMDGTRVV